MNIKNLDPTENTTPQSCTWKITCTWRWVHDPNVENKQSTAPNMYCENSSRTHAADHRYLAKTFAGICSHCACPVITPAHGCRLLSCMVYLSVRRKLRICENCTLAKLCAFVVVHCVRHSAFSSSSLSSSVCVYMYFSCFVRLFSSFCSLFSSFCSLFPRFVRFFLILFVIFLILFVIFVVLFPIFEFCSLFSKFCSSFPCFVCYFSFFFICCFRCFVQCILAVFLFSFLSHLLFPESGD